MLTQIKMVGRPKNPNKPPAVTAVRVSKRTFKKIREHHRGTEPFDVTVERAFDELDELKKKAVGHQLDIDSLNLKLETVTNSFDKLFNIHQQTKLEVSRLQEERRTIVSPESLK